MTLSITLGGHIFVCFGRSNFFAGAKFNNGLTRGGGGRGGGGGGECQKRVRDNQVELYTGFHVILKITFRN